MSAEIVRAKRRGIGLTPAVPDSRKALALGGNIGVRAARLVVQAGELVAERRCVSVHSGVLVCRSGKVVGVPAAGYETIGSVKGDDFRVEEVRRAD